MASKRRRHMRIVQLRDGEVNGEVKLDGRQKTSPTRAFFTVALKFAPTHVTRVVVPRCPFARPEGTLGVPECMCPDMTLATILWDHPSVSSATGYRPKCFPTPPRSLARPWPHAAACDLAHGVHVGRAAPSDGATGDRAGGPSCASLHPSDRARRHENGVVPQSLRELGFGLSPGASVPLDP